MEDRTIGAEIREEVVKAFRTDLELVERLGDEVAEREGYKHLRGEEAVRRYLIDKHHWMLEQARSVALQDILMLMDGYSKGTKPRK